MSNGAKHSAALVAFLCIKTGVFLPALTSLSTNATFSRVTTTVIPTYGSPGVMLGAKSICPVF